MLTKFNILLCALFVLGLAVSQVHAQIARNSYTLGAKHMEVAEHGHNQEVGAVILRYVAASTSGTDVVIPANGKIDLTFGGLVITTPSASVAPMCTSTLADIDPAADGTSFAACTTVTAAISDDKKKLTLTSNQAGGSADIASNIAVSGLRLDVTGVDADAAVMVTASSAGTTGVDFGSGAGLTASRQVATVKTGITVAVTHASRLYCSDVGAGMPSVSVTEGFASAWEAEGDTGSIGATNVKLKILNVPAGVTFVWPGQKHDDAGPNPTAVKDLRAADHATRTGTGVTAIETLNSTVATLEFVPAGLSADTSEAVYKFMPMDYATDAVLGTDSGGTAINPGAAESHMNRADTFKIELVVKIDQAKAGAGGTADIWAWLHPTPGFEDRGTKLSYMMSPTTQDTNDDKVIDEEDGDILSISECVTYLLYPFVTCGSTAGWSTGISVANTTMDDDVFGAKKGAAPQSGSVTLYGYPKSAKAADGSSGEMMDPVMMMLSPNLASGDTIAAPCPMVVEGGWEGYAIVRAGFRHAHGLAFVLGDMDGGGLDVAHGYMGLVIPDPQFNEGLRGTQISESLDQ
ncbi:MAG: hypothetical protein F4Z21_05285 [Acidobacteria bacterium]|nr:hypothetical protein [Acidobacteriota bacterium]